MLSSIRSALGELLASRVPATMPSQGIAASVLIPLVDLGGVTHVWLIKRPANMAKHPGQVAFPGGKRDATDVSALETALRESEEEIGFARTEIDVLGQLDDMITTTGFVVSPFVGWLRKDLIPQPNREEIDRVFRVPLGAFVFEKPRPRPLAARGIARVMPSWQVDGEIVWGATAHIIGEFAEMVREAGKYTE